MGTAAEKVWTEDALEDLQERLAEHLGENVVVYFENGALHLYNDKPEDYEGLPGEPLFSTNLLMSEHDDSRHRLVQRFEEFVVSLDVDEFRRDTSYVSGCLLECEPGSPEEAAFLQEAILAMLQEASEPLRGSWMKSRPAAL